jgi:hypothetical protein
MMRSLLLYLPSKIVYHHHLEIEKLKCSGQELSDMENDLSPDTTLLLLAKVFGCRELQELQFLLK